MKDVIASMLCTKIKLKENNSYIRFSQGKSDDMIDELYFLHVLQRFLTDSIARNKKELLECAIYLTRKNRGSSKELVPLIHQHYNKTINSVDESNVNTFLLKLHQLPLVAYPNTHLYLSNVLALFSILERSYATTDSNEHFSFV